MTPREYVAEQINHRETTPVPYTLPIYPSVAEQMDIHYGSAAWRDRIAKYIDDKSFRDAYGGLWQKDLNVHHQISVPLENPSLDGFVLPDPEHQDSVSNPRTCLCSAKSTRVHGSSSGTSEDSKMP